MAQLITTRVCTAKRRRGDFMGIYSPADIAALLKVKETTLRKYSLLLEEVGYSFKRNAQKQRWYEDNDVIALQKFVSLKHNGDMSLKECAEAVWLLQKNVDITDALTVTHNATESDENVTALALRDEMVTLKDLIIKQNEHIMQLQKNLVEEKEQQKNRDELILKMLQDLQEQKENSPEELPAPKENQSFFKKLFKK